MLIESVRRSFAKPKDRHLYTLFVDFRTAFDSIDRNRLLGKLKEIYGLEDHYLAMMACFLQTNQITFKHEQCQCGRYHGQQTMIDQNVGVMQGDSLSPLLFILYINDMISEVEDPHSATHALLYADDTVVYSESREGLVDAITRLSEWCRSNGIAINKDKTKMMKFRKGGRLAKRDTQTEEGTPTFHLDGTPIEMVKEYVYLGVTMKTGLSFYSHIKRVCAKAAAKIGTLPAAVSKLSLEKGMKVFEAQIKPVVTYGLHLFVDSIDATAMGLLDSAKSRFLKRIL